MVRAPGCYQHLRGQFALYEYCLTCVLKSQYNKGRIPGMEVNATKLKELREACGLSVRGLAKEAVVSTETVYSVEHGKRQPSMKTLDKIARALGANPVDLLTR